jgi:hypothetical protein
LQLPYEEACNRALTKARLVGQTRPWCRRQPVKSVCHSAMARSKARSVAALTELQPHHDTASGTDSHSPRAIAIGRNTPGVSLCSCTSASYIDSRCRLIGLSEAFCACRIGRLLCAAASEIDNASSAGTSRANEKRTFGICIIASFLECRKNAWLERTTISGDYLGEDEESPLPKSDSCIGLVGSIQSNANHGPVPCEGAGP